MFEFHVFRCESHSKWQKVDESTNKPNFTVKTTLNMKWRHKHSNCQHKNVCNMCLLLLFRLSHKACVLLKWKNWTKNAHRHPGINDMNILTAKSKKVQQNIYMSISLYKSIAKYILTCNENAQNARIPLDLWNVAFDRKVQWIPF